jgi:hypothetical protein
LWARFRSHYLWLGVRLLQRLPQWQAQLVLKETRARRAQPEMRGEMPIDAARMKKSVLRKHDEPKIKELQTREPEIATIRAAQAASTYLRRLMDGRAAFGIKELTGRWLAFPLSDIAKS